MPNNNPGLDQLNFILGTNEDDVLPGTEEDDFIRGFAGIDTIEAGDGDDVVEGDAGDDDLDGGSGNDVVNGGKGDDVLDGGPGSDTVSGGDGDDLIVGDGNDNVLDGGDGFDTLDLRLTEDQLEDEAVQKEITAYLEFLPSIINPAGIAKNKPFVFDSLGGLTVRRFEDLDPFLLDLSGSPDDQDITILNDLDLKITTGDGNDEIEVGDGDNVIDAGEGDNQVTTGDGNNTIVTGGGSDEIFTGNGDDHITSGNGPDVVVAGGGNNIIIGGVGDGDDIYDGTSGNTAVNYPSSNADMTIDLRPLDRELTQTLGGSTVGALLSANGYVPDSRVGLAEGADTDTDILIQIVDATGGNGNDIFYGSPSFLDFPFNNILDGGPGIDRTIYEDSFVGFDLDEISPNEFTVTDTNPFNGNHGVDTLKNMERVEFSDTTIYLDDPNLRFTFRDPAPTVSDFFGEAVAISGNLALIGQDGHAINTLRVGQAQLFDAATGKLLHTFDDPTPATPASNLVGDNFGESVAVDGNLVLIGAPSDESSGTRAGQAHLFDATTGNLLHTFDNPTPSGHDGFGFSVAISGNLVLIGEPFDDSDGQLVGLAHLFDATTFQLLHTFHDTTVTAGSSDTFGYSVAIDGNHVLISARSDDTTAVNAGQVHLFDATTFDELQVFNDPSPTINGHFGTSVAIDGNHVLIGNNFHSTLPGADVLPDLNNGVGEAHLFDATTGNLLHTFDNPTPSEFDRFGTSVDISGNVVLIGEPFDDTIRDDAGQTHLFDAITGSPLHTFDDPTPSSDGFGDTFGISVAIDGTAALIGAASDFTSGTSAGDAHLFDVSGLLMA